MNKVCVCVCVCVFGGEGVMEEVCKDTRIETCIFSHCYKIKAFCVFPI